MDSGDLTNERGNSSSAGEQPLVTFAVIAYNQERFVCDAITAAFAQDYDPMEVILSDDCSTDRTFDIMKEMAAQYRGPKRVRVVRNPTNMGVFAHDLTRGREAEGGIVVLAAGDDISLPDRCSRTVAAFEPDVACVFSRVSIIDPSGRVLAPTADSPLGSGPVTPFVLDADRDTGVIQGCSSAYRKWVFDLPITPSNNTYPEDYFLYNYLVLADAKIVRLPDVLVLYRSHAGSMSNAGDYADRSVAIDETRAWEAAQWKLDMTADLVELAAVLGASDKLNSAFLDRERRVASLRSEWPGLSFRQRCRRTLAISARGFDASNARMLAWCVLRLWGRLPEYQPKSLVSRFQKKYRPKPS